MTPVVQGKLLSHPATPCDFLQGIAFSLGREECCLHLRFTLRGDLDRLLLPAPCTPDIADGLWRHTCGEAFFGTDLPGATDYDEFNLAPSGLWAHYRFEDYRRPRAALPGTAPRIDVVRGPGELELATVIPLPMELRALPLRAGLAMVVEARAGGLSYWALAHPAAQPDFHHAGGFRLHLPALSAGHAP